MANRRAQLYAVAVEVICPYCEAEQPCPVDGSMMWEKEAIRKHEGERVCCSCDKKFLLFDEPKAQFK